MLQGVLICGTTPIHEFEIPYDWEEIQDIRIIYGQGGKTVFTKRKNDCSFLEGKLSLELSQEETFLFVPSKILDIEIRVKLTSGNIVQTDEPIRLRVQSTMDKEVM